MSSVAWRQIVREQLELLSSEHEQLNYERNVPHIDITAELVAGWINDCYHPMDDTFRLCFSEIELHALQHFDTVFEAQRQKLPPSNGTVRSWLANGAWRQVMGAASDALSVVRLG